MLKKRIYPICAETFKKWCLSNKKYTNIFLSLGTLETFDVTLRDGLQSIPAQELSLIHISEPTRPY